MAADAMHCYNITSRLVSYGNELTSLLIPLYKKTWRSPYTCQQLCFSAHNNYFIIFVSPVISYILIARREQYSQVSVCIFHSLPVCALIYFNVYSIRIFDRLLLICSAKGTKRWFAFHYIYVHNANCIVWSNCNYKNRIAKLRA